ncbi:hypothetical protein Rhe02_79230 [Rhizocola hellebori]|uniref:Uncharacterized protein n=1 Tax=Rhizocola hellebori TaxID=1392758 RepID=A0A8J3QFY6_9ACTN|nr:hypothetical protein Rhe02_79230 [Rhizocola hellebori]
MAALACGLALSGCGKKPDDGIASAGQNQAQATGSPVSEDPQERARQFAQCMRDQGIEMPDPEFTDDGGMSIQIGPGEGGPVTDAQGIDPKQDMSKFEEAHKACQQFMPSGGEMGKPDPEMEAKMREFAKCMRENGVENFPDPSTEGGGIIIGGPNSENGIDPSDPTFKAAQEKCAALMPKMQMRKEGPGK